MLPLACRAALKIRWDQTWDKTNEVVFTAGSSCKEMRSQLFQLEGNWKDAANLWPGRQGKEGYG